MGARMTARERPESRSTFVLKIEGRPGAAGIHGLRALLKVLLRKYGFKCLDAREDVAKSGTCSAFASTPDVSNQVADAFSELRRNVSRRS